MRIWRFLMILLIGSVADNSHAQSPEVVYDSLSKTSQSTYIVKFKIPSEAGGRINSSPEEMLRNLESRVPLASAKQVFPQLSKSSARISAGGLENIYEIQLAPGINTIRALEMLRLSGMVEYVEPYIPSKPLYIPNDPQANPNGGEQDYLAVIKAYDGWQIEKADSTIVIGIVDTGVKMDHEDLGNIAINHADPINGFDDDGDGYIDNYRGWDIADEDNNPAADGHPHGSFVAGMSSATTDNNKGIAGLGFHSRYLPVKIAETASQVFNNEFGGVVYAADHGCSVINLSWGADGNYSKLGQDVINYAVLQKDVVVVAAAGNTNASLNFYPASFDNVLSVGATDINDIKAPWATYSYSIDLMAPGHNVYTTNNSGGYGRTGGSSYAAPLVSGAAALVRAHFPELTAQQVMEQLRVTADDIYSKGTNISYFGQLGKGRLNVHKALTDILTPAVRMSAFTYNSRYGKLLFAGDTVTLNLTFTNYLRTAENITVSFSSPSNNASWENEDLYIPKLQAFEEFSDPSNPLTFIINENALPGEKLLLRMDYIGNNYSDFQYLELQVTPGYFDVTDGLLSATIGSDGDIGYDDAEYKNGNGISYLDKYVAMNAGLIISTDTAHVMDNVINNYKKFTADADFQAENSLRLYDNSTASMDARSSIRPANVSSRLPLKVEQKVLAWQHEGKDGHLIFEYRLINTGDSVIHNLNAGIYTDWDLGSWQSNNAALDSALRMGFVFDKTANDLFAGLALLSDHELAHYAIDIDSMNGNTSDLNLYFADSTKHRMLSTNTPKKEAGQSGLGNDVAHIIGAKNINLQPGESAKVAISMLASTSLEGLKKALDSAKPNYSHYLKNPAVSETFFACIGDSAMVDPQGDLYEFYSDLALTVRLDSGTVFKTGPVFKDSLYYAVNLDSGYRSDIMSLWVRPGNPVADFSFADDTLLIEAGESGVFQIENRTTLGETWSWDFGNGYQSTLKEPVVVYSSPGNYTVSLQVTNSYGCSDTMIQVMHVAERSVRPLVNDEVVCKGATVLLHASNSPLIHVYEDAGLTNLLYMGDTIETGPISRDTTFFVTNMAGDFESLAMQISIRIQRPAMGFEYIPDSTNLTDKHSLMIRDTAPTTGILSWYINDQLAGSSQSITYTYTAAPFEIMQVKKDPYGCSDTLAYTIKPAVSITPAFSETTICKNSSMTLRPNKGTYFCFYADATRGKLLHKGTSLHMDRVTSDTTLFVTGLDSLLESPVAQLSLKLNPVKAFIASSADSIDLALDSAVTLTNQSEHSIITYWLLPGGAYETEKVLQETYEQSGVYPYTAVAQSAEGCLDTARANVTVFYITGLESQRFPKLQIYPNPANAYLTIELLQPLEEAIEMEIINMTGFRIMSFEIAAGAKSYQLSVQSWNPGVYFLRTGHQVWKVLKKE